MHACPENNRGLDQCPRVSRGTRKFHGILTFFWPFNHSLLYEDFSISPLKDFPEKTFQMASQIGWAVKSAT